MILRNLLRASAAVLVASIGTVAGAATLDWQGGTGDILSSNYVDTNTLSGGLPPGSGNVLNIGSLGTATYETAGNTLTVSRLFVGHTVAPNPGDGTVLINDGTIVASGGSSGVANSAVMIGFGANGTIIMNGGTLTSTRPWAIGYGNDSSLSATLNVGTGAFIQAKNATLFIGSGPSNAAGIAGNVSFAGSGTFNGDLVVGDLAGSSYTQTGGSITFNGGNVDVGRSTNGSSTFTISSGTITSNSFTVSDMGTSQANYVFIGGDAYVRTTVAASGHNFTIGSGSLAVGTTFNISGNATVSSGNRFLVGSSATTKDLAHNITVNQSGGTLTTSVDVRVGDANGYATYNLSGGTILTNNGILVSRQGIGRLYQTGGTAIAAGASGLRVGDSESATILTNDGLWQISGGTISASGIALGNNGTGTLSIVGGDSHISGTGNFTAKAVVGTTTSALAFKLESGESLTEVVMAGTASFAAGTYVTIDDAGNTPTQAVYDLLTATSITDSGLIFQAPPNWTYTIVPGGNGQVLEVTVPEPGSLALFALAGMALSRRRRRYR